MSDKHEINDLRFTKPWNPEGERTQEDWDSPENQRIQNENFPKDASVFVGQTHTIRPRTIITFATVIPAGDFVDPYGRKVEVEREIERELRKVVLMTEVTNVLVGQKFAFDHPQMGLCLKGVVTNVQHVVNLDNAVLTYIDVRVED